MIKWNRKDLICNESSLEAYSLIRCHWAYIVLWEFFFLISQLTCVLLRNSQRIQCIISFMKSSNRRNGLNKLITPVCSIRFFVQARRVSQWFMSVGNEYKFQMHTAHAHTHSLRILIKYLYSLRTQRSTSAKNAHKSRISQLNKFATVLNAIKILDSH